MYKFERLQPLSYYATAEQPPRKGALPWGRSGKDDILADRCRMVRCSPLALSLIITLKTCMQCSNV